MLKNLSVEDFMKETGSDSPAPGGGSIAALSASSAASLIEMVANLTIGKKGYEEVEVEMKDIKERAAAYRERFVNFIDEDANSFNKVMEAFKMPKETDEEKKARSKVMQDGFKLAADVPFGIAKTAYELFDLADKVVEKGNKNAVTDGAVATLSAKTAIYAALYNVKINLGSIKDEDYVSNMEKNIEDLEKNIEVREKEILSKVKL